MLCTHFRFTELTNSQQAWRRVSPATPLFKVHLATTATLPRMCNTTSIRQATVPSAMEHYLRTPLRMGDWCEPPWRRVSLGRGRCPLPNGNHTMLPMFPAICSVEGRPHVACLTNRLAGARLALKKSSLSTLLCWFICVRVEAHAPFRLVPHSPARVARQSRRRSLLEEGQDMIWDRQVRCLLELL